MNLCWDESLLGASASYEARSVMIRNYLSRYAVVGLLLGLLIVPAPPVQAQFTVWDPTNYALQLAKKIEEANRWLETIRHYATMVDKTVQQLTSMQGVSAMSKNNWRAMSGWCDSLAVWARLCAAPISSTGSSKV